MQDFLVGFSAKKWVAWLPYRRVSFLQKIEDMMAVRQGRKRRQIKPSIKIAQEGLGGAYDSYQQDVLLINREWIHQKDTARVYELIDVVVHEGRHAYHDDIVRKRGVTKNLPDKEMVYTWKANIWNTGVYVEAHNPREPDALAVNLIHRYQPVEDDAYSYAFDNVMRDFGRYFGGDKYYTDYMTEMAEANRKNEESAEQIIGKNYRDRIKREVLSKYRASKSSGCRKKTPQTSKNKLGR